MRWDTGPDRSDKTHGPNADGTNDPKQSTGGLNRPIKIPFDRYNQDIVEIFQTTTFCKKLFKQSETTRDSRDTILCVIHRSWLRADFFKIWQCGNQVGSELVICKTPWWHGMASYNKTETRSIDYFGLFFNHTSVTLRGKNIQAENLMVHTFRSTQNTKILLEENLDFDAKQDEGSIWKWNTCQSNTA